MVMISYNQITEDFVVGSCPSGPEEAEHLKEALGISAVLNLQMDEDFTSWGVNWPELEQAYGHLGIELRRVPIVDFDSSNLRNKLREAADALRELVSTGHRVYLHCSVGVERSPTVAVAYLVWCEGWSLDRASEHMRSVRLSAPNLAAIRVAAAGS